MAINIPTTRERSVQSRPQPSVRQNIDTPSAAFGTLEAQAISNTGRAIENFSNAIGNDAIDELERSNELARVDVENRIKRDLDEYAYTPDTGLFNQRGNLGATAHTQMEKKLDEVRKQYLSDESLPQIVRERLASSFEGIESSYMGLARRHASSEYDRYEMQTLSTRKELARNTSALNFYDQAAFKESFDDIESALRAEQKIAGHNEEWFQLERQKEFSSMRVAQIQSLVETGSPSDILLANDIFEEAGLKGQLLFDDVARARGIIKPHYEEAVATTALGSLRERGPTELHSFEGAINQIIDDIEGGDTVADEPGGNKAVFGINSAAHPDEFNKIMSLINAGKKDEARQVALSTYKNDYFDAYGIDEIPEHLRYVALNTVINHRAGFKDSVIKKIKSGEITTVDQVINIRQKEYLRLARADKDGSKGHRAALAGWYNRLEKERDSVTVPISNDDALQEAARLEELHGTEVADKFIDRYENSIRINSLQKRKQYNTIAEEILAVDVKTTTPQKLAQIEASINQREVRKEITKGEAGALRRLLKTKDETVDMTDAQKLTVFNDVSNEMMELRLKLTGSIDEGGTPSLNPDNIRAIEAFEATVMSKVGKGITRAEAKAFLTPVTAALDSAIQAEDFETTGFTIQAGVQDPFGNGLERINKYLENNGQSDSIVQKREIFTRFSRHLGHFDENDNYVPTGSYESTGNHAMDERVIRKALDLAVKSMNEDEYAGIIDAENPPNKFVNVINPRPYRVQKDAQGNYAKVFEDGTFEEITQAQATALAGN